MPTNHVAHVAHEPNTRAAAGIIDGDLPAWAAKIAWCGRRITGWHFVDATHVLLTIEQGSGITTCRDCLRRIRTIVNHELDGDVIIDRSIDQRVDR